MAEVCHAITKAFMDAKQPIRGIAFLIDTIRKIQKEESQLTSIHADLCQLCLASKCLKPALQFLDVDITDISREVCMILHI